MLPVVVRSTRTVSGDVFILRRNALYVREIIYALCVGDLPQ